MDGSITYWTHGSLANVYSIIDGMLLVQRGLVARIDSEQQALQNGQHVDNNQVQ